MGASHGFLDAGNVAISVPSFISGKSGALTVPAAGSAIATLQNLGRIDPNAGPGAALLLVPLRIVAIRMKFVLTSGATSTPAFEVYKGAVTTQHTVGGVARTPILRKPLGYVPITAAEINLFIATTGAISGGTFVPEGDPIDMMGVTPGGASPFVAGFGESIWTPNDTCPLTLEAGQGCEARVTQQGAAVGVFFISFDLMRQ